MSTRIVPREHGFRATWAGLQLLPRAVRLVVGAAPGWTVGWLALLLVQGLLPAGLVAVTRPLVDAVVAAVRAPATPAAERALLLALVAGVLLVLTELLQPLVRWVRVRQTELVDERLTVLLHEQAVAADLAFYDSPEYFDHLHRVRFEARSRPMAVLESLGSFAQSSVTLLAMAALLVRFGLGFSVLAVASALPTLLVVLRQAVRQREFRLRTTEDERRGWYLDWLLTGRESAAELRLFGLGPHMAALHGALRSRLRGERVRLARDQALVESIAGMVALLLAGGAVALVGARVVRGGASVGDLAMVYQAFVQAQRFLRSLLADLGRVLANSLFLADLFTFLDLRPTIAAPDQGFAVPTSLSSGLSFRSVTFRYPGEAGPAIQGLDLEVPAGRTTAIVGPNGAGKSTLVKLACRLYDPEDGEVLLDGIDLRRVDPAELRRSITSVFQEPVHFNATLAENIGFGDVGATVGRGAVERAAALSGADVVAAHLVDGYDTLLGRWFTGGHEPSVGEWRRVALARALVRPAPLVLLDEPTSSMDVWGEAEWLGRMEHAMRGRTVLLITHRLAAAAHADLIHVMERGRIVESGSHAELLQAGGLYAQRWRTEQVQTS